MQKTKKYKNIKNNKNKNKNIKKTKTLFYFLNINSLALKAGRRTASLVTFTAEGLPSWKKVEKKLKCFLVYIIKVFSLTNKF